MPPKGFGLFQGHFQSQNSLLNMSDNNLLSDANKQSDLCNILQSDLAMWVHIFILTDEQLTTKTKLEFSIKLHGISQPN